MNQASAAAYVAPYVQVRHAIHLLYATSPRSRDGHSTKNVRFDKNGLPLPLEGVGCGCSLCARARRRLPGVPTPKAWGK